MTVDWNDSTFPHEGDCIGSLCPDCGCCMHTPTDQACDGCNDSDCLCGGAA